MPEKRASSEGELAHDRRNMQIFKMQIFGRDHARGQRTRAGAPKPLILTMSEKTATFRDHALAGA
jgi:hypothetical protein